MAPQAPPPQTKHTADRLWAMFERTMKTRILIILLLILTFGCSKQSKKDCVGENIFIKGDTISGDYSIVANFLKMKIVKKEKLFGLINSEKQIILPLEYDTIEHPRLADYFYLTKNNLTGVLTEQGCLTIPIFYEHIEYDRKIKPNSNEEDCFIVQKNKKLGSIDFYNHVIIPIEYDGISNWVEYGPDAHYVKKGNLYGLINYYTGELIVPVLYDGLEVHGNLIEIKNKGLYGVISRDKEVVIPCIYNKVFIDDDEFGFKKNHVDRIYTEKDNVWSEFEINGKLLRLNVPTTEVDTSYLTFKPDSNEYWYHLRALMVFPKNY